LGGDRTGFLPRVEESSPEFATVGLIALSFGVCVNLARELQI
jgi:hypothetical protein